MHNLTLLATSLSSQCLAQCIVSLSSLLSLGMRMRCHGQLCHLADTSFESTMNCVRCILLYARSHTHARTRTHAHTHARTHARTHTHTHTHTHARTHAHTHAPTHTHAHTHTHIHAHTHTHTHTHRPKRNHRDDSDDDDDSANLPLVPSFQKYTIVRVR
jgi:hypothetical protein